MTARSFLGGIPAECGYDKLRAVVARREGERILWAARFTHLRIARVRVDVDGQLRERLTVQTLQPPS